MPNNIERPKGTVKAFCAVENCTRAAYVLPEVMEAASKLRLSERSRMYLFACDAHTKMKKYSALRRPRS